jgi:hypothetical protein
MKNDEKQTVITFNGTPFSVPPGGTLGILALGNIGIRAWKKAKKEYEQQLKNGEKEK